ncbi:hypothetical protein GCM10020254_63910 [Streptomyces goshikiensis]
MCSGGVRDVPQRVEQRRVEHGGVQPAPGLGAVAADGALDQGRVGVGDQVEGAVAGQQEGVAALDGVREDLQGERERAVYGADLEGAVERGEGLGERQAAQHPVDGADLERVAGGVDEQDQAEVPAGGGLVLLLEAQVRRPAVVAVGDEGLDGGRGPR